MTITKTSFPDKDDMSGDVHSGLAKLLDDSISTQRPSQNIISSTTAGNRAVAAMMAASLTTQTIAESLGLKLVAVER